MREIESNETDVCDRDSGVKCGWGEVRSEG